ncbi:hypothetical protein HMPREF2863_00605 [Micrococcus sp. HMSC067E09]|nr:hypothetical protein HMPREF2863_00605 [Micrococcus sp. HMSC067E09]
MTCAAAQAGVLGWLAGETGGVNARRRDAAAAVEQLEWVLGRLRAQRSDWEDCLRHLSWAEEVRWVSDAARGYLRQVADMKARGSRVLDLVAEAEASLSAAVEQARAAEAEAIAEQQALQWAGKAVACG